MSGSGRLAGKRAIITGAGSGIGRAIALAYGAEGARVVCSDLDRDTADETASQITRAGGRAVANRCDVSQPEAVQQAIAVAEASFLGLDILVNNAAYFAPRKPLAELEEDIWHRNMAVNLTGCFLMSKYAIPVMARSGGGSIIHVASAHARVANFGQTAYSTSKGGLLMMAKGIATDHARDGIRCNTLSPGGIATQGMADLYGGDWQRAEEEWGKPMHVLGRNGTVEEMAAGAVFLGSDESSFMTGTDLLLDGGMTAR
ncbi:MAG: SDR family NAD(P)-dependent oxidoreductase [Alphaproteobacteria bacterium]